MPDEMDYAVEAQLQAIEDRTNAIRRENVKKLLHTGYCYYCGEGVDSPKAFCDSQCRDDYDWEQTRLRINGKL